MPMGYMFCVCVWFFFNIPHSYMQMQGSRCSHSLAPSISSITMETASLKYILATWAELGG